MLACKQEGMSIEFEYTAAGTPYQNGHVEGKFATLFNRILAMLNSGNFSYFGRNDSWAKATNTATFLKNNLLTLLQDLTPFQLFLERELEVY